MIHTISNQFLKASINSKGAELTSLKKDGSEAEYIWEADPEVWGRHAPLLFPVVGRLKNDRYTFQGQEYTLGQHGFARNMEFSNLVNNSESVIFELQENDDTLRDFPFHFALQVSFYLRENYLYTKYEVHNTDDKTIYFSIGGHPGFTCPLNSGESRSDYSLEFEKIEQAESYILEGGTISGRTKKVIEGKSIALSNDLFDEDALIFKDLKSEKVSLMNSAGKAILHFHFAGFPYLGIWSKSQTSPYVCVEPWFGLADNHDHNGALENKEGIQTLEPNCIFRCEFGIEIE